MTTEGLTRRHTLCGAALLGVSVPVLAACGEGGDDPITESGASGPTINCACHGSRFSAVDGSVVSGPASSPLEAAEVSVSGGAVEVDGEVLGPAADVPEGGGTVFADQKVVVTQLEADDFKAFSAVCPHQGCVVRDVSSS